MKPRKLIMKNIGPFTGETIVDFSQLNEIFLITGRTGAGKTTIFDAMCYALYGEAPGARSRADRQMLKSHFAPPDEESRVELIFSIGGASYRIARVLPGRHYSAARKKYIDDEEQAVFERFENGVWKEISAKQAEIKKQVVSVVGLSADEFFSIVLLPQGEFADFLRQNSSERKRMLQKIFPIELYSQIAAGLKEKAKETMTRLEEAEKKIAEFNADFSAETAEADIASETRLADELRANLNALSEKNDELVQRMERAAEFEKKTNEKSKLEEEQSILAKSKNDIDFLRKKTRLHEKAEPLLLEREKRDEAEERLKNIRRAIENDDSLLRDKRIEFDRLAERQDLIGAFRLDLKSLENDIPSLRDAVAAQEEINKKRRLLLDLKKKESAQSELLTRAEKRVSELRENLKRDQKLSEDLSERIERNERADERLQKLRDLDKNAKEALKTAARLDQIDGALNSARSDIAAAAADCAVQESIARELETAERAEVLAASARVLAGELRSGTPCPVCGALEHPSPAARAAGDVSIKAKVDCARRTYDEMLAKKNSAEGSARALEAQLLETWRSARGEFESLLDGAASAECARAPSYAEDIDSAAYLGIIGEYAAYVSEELAAQAKIKEAAQKAQDDASRAASRRDGAIKELREAEEDLREPDDRLRKIKEEIAAARGYIDRLREQYPQTALAGGGEDAAVRLAEAEKRADDLREQIESHDRARESLSLELASLESKKLARLDERDRLQKEFHEIENRFKSRLESSSYFSREEELNAARMSESEISGALNEIANYDSRANEIQSQLLFLSEDLASQKEEKTRADLQSLLDETKSLEKEAREKYNAAVLRASGLASQFKQWKANESDRAKLSAESAALKKLADDLNGDNPKKKSFEAWILGLYLEEIAAYANARLERMSGGRYRLCLNPDYRRKNAQTGLDLEIFDAYTGRLRPCATLSGGETFMASISLALGLADSVQNRSGGIRLDAVFIDEGFGSLDESSLEKALSILDEIRDHRMVGIISHVSDLKTRIPSQIEVEKTTSGSTLRVIG